VYKSTPQSTLKSYIPVYDALVAAMRRSKGSEVAARISVQLLIDMASGWGVMMKMMMMMPCRRPS
jgi:hypothetical protein